MPQLVGGTSAVKDATPDVQEVVNKVKAETETKLGKTFDEFVAKNYKSQVVAGTNFFVKVSVGNEEFLHLRIYRDLKQDIFLHGVLEGKTEEEDIVYFQQ